MIDLNVSFVRAGYAIAYKDNNPRCPVCTELNLAPCCVLIQNKKAIFHCKVWLTIKAPSYTFIIILSI